MTDQPNKTRIKFMAIAWNRLIVIGLLLSISIIYAHRFTLAFLGEDLLGNWLFLGGPSLWWATSFLNSFAIGYLMIFCILTSKQVEILQGNQILIKETYLWHKDQAEINEETIQSIQASTTRIGGKNFWVIFFGIQIWYLAVDGIAWISNPFAFGLGITTGWVYIIQGFIDLTALFFIIGIPPIEVKYITQSEHILLQIPGIRPKYYRKLSKILQSNKIIQSDQFRIQINRTTKRKIYFYVGIIAISVSIIGKTLRTFVSDPLSISLLLAGLIWLNYGWNYILPTTIRFPKVYLAMGTQTNIRTRDPSDNTMIVWNTLILLNLAFWIGFGIYSNVLLGIGNAIVLI